MQRFILGKKNQIALISANFNCDSDFLVILF